MDEAHLFAPEKGKSEASSAVIDLATRGRKREFCAVLATQRISKLNKDAAAECLNKLIGRTGLDIDMKRAADDLGLSTKDKIRSLRDLDPGHFYTFGPAISKGVNQVRIGKVKTKHGKAARRSLARQPAPTARVKKVLSKLVDLPQAAEKELRDKQEMTKKIQDLKRQLKAAGGNTIVPEKREELIQQGYEKGKSEVLKMLVKLKNRLTQKMDELGKLIQQIPEQGADSGSAPTLVRRPNTTPSFGYKPGREPKQPKPVGAEYRGTKWGPCERKILGFLLMKGSATKIQVGAMTGYAYTSGGFNNAISKLSKAGYIHRDSGNMSIVSEYIEEVRSIVGDAVPHTLEDWINKLGKCERKIYQTLLDFPDDDWKKEDLADHTGYAPSSGGFNNALSRLKTLGLINRPRGGLVTFNQELL